MAQLYFYYSAMNAGKSTTLLQSAHNYLERGMNALLFTPALDDRDGQGKITSRIGVSAAAVAFHPDHDFYESIREVQQKEIVHCVLIDEAQFLTPLQVLQLTRVCDHLNVPVLCYGIRTDFRGEPFSGSMYLLAWADNIMEIKTICRSGKKATMNARLDENGNQVSEGAQVDIGHHYEAMSRKEFGLERVSPVARKLAQNR
jgi:thymidine kinase